MKKVFVAVFIFIILLAAMLQSNPTVEGDKDDISFIIQMSGTLSNNGTKTWDLIEEDRTFNLFMNNTWQTVMLINHSYPLETNKSDGDGNPIAVLQFPKSELQPGENISYTISCRAIWKPRLIPSISEVLSETLNEIPQNLTEEYCQEEGPWLLSDTELRNLTQNVAQNETNVLAAVNKFVVWIWQNIQAPHTPVLHEVPLYPNETFKYKEGDCDDQAVLLITLCRIYGIPSYLQTGCMYMPELGSFTETLWDGHATVVSKRIGWHGWAIVYVPPWGWLPFDLTYAIGGKGNPLNAIKTSAVVMRKTIQWMNVSQTDYVASARKQREFVKSNNLYIYEEDEITQETPTEDFWNEQLPWIFIATLTATVIILGVVAWKAQKKRLKRVSQPVDLGSQQSPLHKLPSSLQHH